MTTPIDRAAEGYPSFRVALLGLFALTVACFFSLLDRQILSLLVQPMKRDLGLSDTEIGALQGIGFALSYSLMALPFGWMADRFHRFRLITVGMLVWCLATLASGFSNSFTELLIARVLVGAGEAALMPAAYSLLADYFPPHQRGRVFAAYMSAIIAGTGGALVVGGLILHALAGAEVVQLSVLGEFPVWKAAFVIVSLPGFVVALSLLFFREPPRRDHPQEPSERVGLVHYVRRHPQAFFTILTAYSMLALVGYAVNSWAPTLLIRNYGLQPSTSGVVTGIGFLIVGLAGAAVSGILGDRWTIAGRRGGRLPLTYFLWFAGFPALALFGFAGNVSLAVAGYLCFAFTAGIGFVSSSAVIQEMVPGNLRGQMTALWYLFTGIIANGFGPLLTGVLNDSVFRSEAALPYSILTIAGPCLLIGLIVTATGISAYDKACLRRA